MFPVHCLLQQKINFENTHACYIVCMDDGWMTCDFTSFLTVFQSYQDDVWMVMKGCVQWNSVYGRVRIELGPLDQ